MKNLYQLVRDTRARNQKTHTTELVPTISDITDVLVILGSSRSGSTLLHHILSQHPSINSLPGEEITYFRLHECYQNLDAHSDDRLSGLELDYQAIANSILRDTGKVDKENLADQYQLVDRLLLQWPHLLEQTTYENLWKQASTSTNYFGLINSLGLEISRYAGHLTNFHQELASHSILIEEPPFIEPIPRKFQREKRNVLLLKSSSNAYRMQHVLKLFPFAQFHYLLLSRKAEDVINGLYDGWNSSGFHSHNVQDITSLNITGYSSQSWWKFDLPPGWINYKDRSLAEVAGFQCSSSYRAILDFLKNKNFNVVHYDSIFEITKLEKEINHFLKAIDLPRMELGSTLPEIMITQKPSKDRWLEKKNMIIPVANSKEIVEITKELREIV